MKKNRICTAAVTAVLAVGMAFSASAGWEGSANNNWKYIFDDGTYAKSQVITLNGKNYGFDQNANMVKGWLQRGDGSWNYFSPETGEQLYGWQQVNGVWYYLNPGKSGNIETGMMTLGSKKYFFDENGAMKTGSIEYNGYTYFADADGAIRCNMTKTENGISIRYDEEGREWYRNAENIVNGIGGGDTWLLLLPGTKLDDQRSIIQESNKNVVQQYKIKLYEDYKENVKTADYKKRSALKTKWEKKAQSELEAMYLSADEIKDFITRVKNGTFDELYEYGTSSSDDED